MRVTMTVMALALRTGIFKRNETLRLIVTAFCGAVIGVLIGLSFTRFGFASNLVVSSVYSNQANLRSPEPQLKPIKQKVPVGTETLPRGIIVAETDLYQRRLWGNPDEDLLFKPKYLLTLTVGLEQKDFVNKAVQKFTKDWLIVLFHYDGHTDGWDEFEWSQHAVHISARKQTKWWYAKRFLHPDVIAPYEYIFIWDEDLDLEHFNAEEYIKLVKKHGLEISQPGLEPDRGLTWQMTKRRGDVEVHKQAEEKPGWCTQGPQKPPCAAFVEIMAPVFSRKAWRCVWHMIQNDLVHGWGLDFSLQKCAQPAHEKIGVIDAQYIKHKGVPSLGNQGHASDGKQPWEGVRERCRYEWKVFSDRMKKAEELEEQRKEKAQSPK